MPIVFLPSLSFPLHSATGIENPVRLKTFPDEFPPQNQIIEKSSTVTIEPKETPEEMVELIDMNFPLKFTTSLMLYPNNTP
jgi:hypothetical protein